jgi:hypothetical protein
MLTSIAGFGYRAVAGIRNVHSVRELRGKFTQLLRHACDYLYVPGIEKQLRVVKSEKVSDLLGEYGSSAAVQPKRHEPHEHLATVYRRRKCTIGCTEHHFGCASVVRGSNCVLI